MVLKKWVKNIQTEGYNGAHTVYTVQIVNSISLIGILIDIFLGFIYQNIYQEKHNW